MTLRQIRLLTLGIWVLAVIIFIGLVSLRLKDARQVEQNMLAKNAELTALDTEVKKMKASIESIVKEQEEFQKYLFAERDVPGFLDGVSSFAKEKQVSIIDMKTQPFTQVPIASAEDGSNPVSQRIKAKREAQQNKPSLPEALTLAAMPINIEMKGTYSAFVGFLGKLEGFEQLLSISSMKIASTQEYPTLHCHFTLKIYSFKTLKDMGIQ